MAQENQGTVISVKDLLSIEKLKIPHYQRPYRWTIKNVTDLLGDVVSHQHKSAYRLGTVVLHRDENQDLNIVDGQQRTLTLMLIVKALLEKSGVHELGEVKTIIEKIELPNHLSSANLRHNYAEIQRWAIRPEVTDDLIRFFLHKCEVVCFELTKLSEAFQFFDSQNARGLDLAPHDLLKAYHLREFPDHEIDLKAKAVEHWEHQESEQIANLIGQHMYRVRQWINGKPARSFGKRDTDLFKGINLDATDRYPYSQALRVVHHQVDEYNSQFQRKIDGLSMTFPFQLDQIIVNGRRFFEMVEHYQKVLDKIYALAPEDEKSSRNGVLNIPISGLATEVLKTLATYKERNRTGDRYIRNLFNCALLFYIDRFGFEELSTAIEKCFIWAYRCRIQHYAVQLATADNHVIEDNLFRTIRDSRRPEDLKAVTWAQLTDSENRNGDKTDDLTKLFKEMKYYV